MILASQLGKEQYGYYSYGMIFFSSISALGAFGMDKTLVRDLVQENSLKLQTLTSSTFFKAILSFVLAIGVIGGSLGFEENTTKQIIVSLFSLAAAIVVISPKAWYDVEGRIHEHALITFFERFIYLLFVLAIIFMTESGTLTYVVGSFLLLKVITLFVEWNGIGFNIKEEFSKSSFDFGSIYKNNSWIWLAAIGNLIMLQYNQIVLEGKLGVAELATFALAFQMIHFIRILQSQILRLSTPRIAVAAMSTNQRVVLKSLLNNSLLVLVGTVLLIVPFYFIIPVIIDKFIGVEYADAIPVFNVLLVWMLIYGVALINNQFLVSLHLQKSYFVTTLVFGITSIWLSIYFIDKFGAKGAALSLLVAHTGSIFVQIFIVLRYIFYRKLSS